MVVMVSMAMRVVMVAVVVMRMRRMVAVLAVMVMVVMAFVQKIRVNFQRGVQVKAAQIKHFVQANLTEMHDVLWCTRVHVLEAVLQRIQFIFGDEFAFADEDLIRKADLTPRFLAVVQSLCSMLGIHQCQH